MRLSFLGGADEVGKQSFLVEAGGATFLLDHGVKPGTRGELGSPPRPPPVDACLLTHSHLDHCGAIPQLMSHDAPPIVATEATREIALLLFDDAMRVAQREGRPPPYTHEAARRTRHAFDTVRPGDRVEYGGVEVTAHAAGHIPGALQFQVHAERELVLSGDINTEGTRLVKRAKVPECDVLVLEATYGGRFLPARQAEEARLIRVIEETLDRGGACILPAFGIGRTQEVLVTITESTGISPWVDGMGGRVLDRYLAMPRSLADAGALRRARSRARFVRGHRDRAQAARRGEVVITTSGMLEGGPVVHYLEVLGQDERSALIITGHQVEGTRGAKLLATGRYPHPQLGDTRLGMRIEQIHLSAHPDHDALVRYAQGTRAEDIILVHGDKEARLALESALQGFARVHRPMNGDTIVL